MGQLRKHRTVEERVAEIDEKIETCKKNIATLEAKKRLSLISSPARFFL